jgi:formylglycine-generating enzyme required for sulfatase activity
MKRQQEPLFSMLEEMDVETPLKAKAEAPISTERIEDLAETAPTNVETHDPPASEPSSREEAPRGNTGKVVEVRPKVVKPQSTSSPKPSLLELYPSLNMEFLFIAPGSFVMGSPESELGRNRDEDQHDVTIAEGFYMQSTPVTLRQWKIVMENTLPRLSKGSPEYPVSGISWFECQEFIRRLNSVGQHVYRLPTEAEWEYACRAGTGTAFSQGEITKTLCGADPSLDAVGWYCFNAGRKIQPVARKEPNAWGLYDMHGNLCEWTRDWYGEYPGQQQTSTSGESDGRDRVARGGCWISGAENCRSATRFHWAPGVKSEFVGLRLVRAEST